MVYDLRFVVHGIETTTSERTLIQDVVCLSCLYNIIMRYTVLKVYMGKMNLFVQSGSPFPRTAERYYISRSKI